LSGQFVTKKDRSGPSCSPVLVDVGPAQVGLLGEVVPEQARDGEVLLLVAARQVGDVVAEALQLVAVQEESNLTRTAATATTTVFSLVAGPSFSMLALIVGRRL
jgi:hypothetical protein